ncbi:MAG: slipin family protein [Bryobacteraceae bacterium]
MLFPVRVRVGDRERAIVIRHGRFERILGPGTYWFAGFGRAIDTRGVDETVYEGPWAVYLAKERADVCERYFLRVETGDAEVALVFFDGKLTRVHGPGRQVLYWRGPVDVTYTIVDARANPEVPNALLPALARMGREAPVTYASVEEGKTGLLYLDGRFERRLDPGTYAFWTAAVTPRVDLIEVRRQTLEIPGQEILTRDKVSIRVNVWTEFQVADPVKARQGVKDYAEHLYRTVQLAVRQTLGRRSLEEILADKTTVDESVAVTVRQEMDAVGVRVGAIALKDIVLPGEMRDILNQVVAAEKQAQANLIRRREETAATRSLLNTARLMEGNPLLLRMKELETLEKVAEKVRKITVRGGLDGVLKDLIALDGGRK